MLLGEDGLLELFGSVAAREDESELHTEELFGSTYTRRSARDEGGAAGAQAGVEAPACECFSQLPLCAGVGKARPEVVALLGIVLHVVELALILVQIVDQLPVGGADHRHEVGAGE